MSTPFTETAGLPVNAAQPVAHVPANLCQAAPKLHRFRWRLGYCMIEPC